MQIVLYTVQEKCCVTGYVQSKEEYCSLYLATVIRERYRNCLLYIMRKAALSPAPLCFSEIQKDNYIRNLEQWRGTSLTNGENSASQAIPRQIDESITEIRNVWVVGTFIESYHRYSGWILFSSKRAFCVLHRKHIVDPIVLLLNSQLSQVHRDPEVSVRAVVTVATKLLLSAVPAALSFEELVSSWM